MSRYSSCFAVVVGAILISVVAHATPKLPWEEYGQVVNARQTLATLGPDLFGDQINLYDRGLSFSLTDISLPSQHSLPVELTRRFSIQNKAPTTPLDHQLGDWSLDLPRIEGVFALSTGWPSARCTGPGEPPPIFVPSQVVEDEEDPEAPPRELESASYSATQYWHGNHAHMPGGGELIRADQDAPAPNQPGTDHRWMTTNFSYFSCLTNINNGSGEGFLAVTSDGTRYWFNHMAQYYAPQLLSVESGPPWTAAPLPRTRAVLYASRVEDRFGNWVEYHFSNAANQPGRLTQIQASDGRLISLTHLNDRIASATAAGKTWTYQYDSAGHLTGVVLPDSSQWTINFQALWNVEIEYDADPFRNCSMTAPVIALHGGTGSITHPSGAVGEFEVGLVIQGRSNVPMACINWEFPILILA